MPDYIKDRDIRYRERVQKPVGNSLQIRWLGRVSYQDAWLWQKGIFAQSREDYLLLLEHNPVYTFGVWGKEEHLKADPKELGADLFWSDRGGDITWHGPGQLVGYPILHLLPKNVLPKNVLPKNVLPKNVLPKNVLPKNVLPKNLLPKNASRPESTTKEAFGEAAEKNADTKNPNKKKTSMADTFAYVWSVEELLLDVLKSLGLKNCTRRRGFAGIWMEKIEKRGQAAKEKENKYAKIASIGVRLSRGRTMHGFALNVNNDLSWFDHIVPCGIDDVEMTSLKKEGIDVSVEEVVQKVTEKAQDRWGVGDIGESAQGISSNSSSASCPNPALNSSLQIQGKKQISGLDIKTRKPEWLRVKANFGTGFSSTQNILNGLNMTTVCEEAGCPNIYECWEEGTATFMINGERCTRSCGFCLVDTSKPAAIDDTEPMRLAESAKKMNLSHVVITAVARDDLSDGGAAGFVKSIHEVRAVNPGISVEVLIPDFKGNLKSVDSVIECRPDVFNHNIETVLKLQKLVRPQARYSRSLAVLARAKEAGIRTKSSIMAGLGETHQEIISTLYDLASVGTDIVTIGQYLRPSARHLPIVRYYEPKEFEDLAEAGLELGIPHIEAGPLVRSSYHARKSLDSTRAREVELSIR